MAELRKIVLIPDSFKGTMTSAEVCSILSRQVKIRMPLAEAVSIPVADGGEGTVDAFLAAMGGEKVSVTVCGPYGKPVPAFYGLTDGEHTAVIETAACAGLPLVGENRHAEKATTYGVGQMIADAAQRGCNKIILGLGGSSTNDGGAGAAAALGIRFLNAGKESFVPVGETLGSISSIDVSGLLPQLKNIEIIAMCDVSNSLCGPRGAAAVFGPQKGADPRTVDLLDRNLAHYADIIWRDLGKNVTDFPGAGAAGGMGAGMSAFLGAEIRPGIETVLDTVHFEEKASDADLIVTGEGKLDLSSLGGKVISGVARRARELRIPLLAIVGDAESHIESLCKMGVTAVFSINRVAADFSVMKTRCRDDLAETMDNILRLILAFPS